jgi:hypothetical protein
VREREMFESGEKKKKKEKVRDKPGFGCKKQSIEYQIQLQISHPSYDFTLNGEFRTTLHNKQPQSHQFPHLILH